MAFNGYIDDTAYIGDVLRKNTFYDQEELQTFLNYLTTKGLQYAIDTQADYAENIRAELDSYDDVRPRKKVCRMSVRDMSDEELYKQNLKIEQNHRNAMDAKWEMFKKTHGIASRPFGELDEEYDDLFETLCLEKKRLSDYLATKPKTYVAPGARPSVVVDITWAKMKLEIEKIENKITNIKKKIEEEDRVWEFNLKHEFLEKNF